MNSGSDALIVLLWACVAGLVTATAIPHPPKHRSYATFTVQVPITAHHHVFDIIPINNNIDATSYAVDIDTWSNPFIEKRILRNITISRTYDIHTQLCVPLNGSKKSSLQIATHGAGFDSRYWDVREDPDQHSYVEAALDAGYSILTYDRLGNGQSSKPDAYTETQLPAAVEVLRVLSEKARDGTMSRLASESHGSLNSSIIFDKIIHVGHSIGSVTTYGLISQYPNVSDAAILTGFLINKEIFEARQTAKDLQYAPDSDRNLFSDRTSGYIITGTQGAYQAGFLSSRANVTTGIGGFSPSLLDYAYSIRQPMGVSEDESGVVLYLDHPSAPGFTGPVHVAIGEFDFAVCRGDCRETYKTTQAQEMFPRAKDVEIYLQPGAGHGLPFHHDARLGFEASLDWLRRNGM